MIQHLNYLFWKLLNSCNASSSFSLAFSAWYWPYRIFKNFLEYLSKKLDKLKKKKEAEVKHQRDNVKVQREEVERESYVISCQKKAWKEGKIEIEITSIIEWSRSAKAAATQPWKNLICFSASKFWKSIWNKLKQRHAYITHKTHRVPERNCCKINLFCSFLFENQQSEKTILQLKHP